MRKTSFRSKVFLGEVWRCPSSQLAAAQGPPLLALLSPPGTIILLFRREAATGRGQGLEVEL